MNILYSIFLRLYYFAILFASIFNRKARFWIKGRKSLFKDLRKQFGKDVHPFWFHCASVGEFEQARPLIESLKKQKPDLPVLLSFFSPSGYELRKNYRYADYVCYLPLDTRSNARKFLEIVKPSGAVFVKYELWPNIMKQCKKSGVKLYLVSGIFRPGQIFFRPIGAWFRKSLFAVDHFFVQDSRSEELLAKAGISRVEVCGDTRFDRVLEIANHPKEFDQLAAFRENSIVIIAGSSWEPEEKMLIHFIHTHPQKHLKFIIAPHEISKKRLQDIRKDIDEEVTLFSELGKSETTIKNRILLVDGVGYLSSLYAHAHIAIIGGGFGKGIHNILEAAVFGIPALFGPRYQKFIEAHELMDEGGAYCINNERDLEFYVEDFLVSPKKLQKAGEISKHYVQSKAGATKLIINKITRLD